MFNSKQENVINRYRRLDLKQRLTILFLVTCITLSEGRITTIDFTNQNPPEKIIPEAPIESIDKYQFCTTSECIDTALRVLDYMDLSLDPCDNFYEYACGQFSNSKAISNEKGNEIDQFSILENKIQLEMKNILEEEYSSTEPRYAKLIKTFYRSCLETTDINKKNLNLISNLLKKLGGWPLLRRPSWKDEIFQWEKFGSQLINLAILENNFILTTLRPDTKNNSNLVIQIQQPSNLDTSSDYFNSIVTTAQIFGADKINVKHDINKIVEIEKRLFNISVPQEDRDDYRDRMTVKELKGNYSNILWKEYFNTYLMPFDTIKDDDVILIADSSYCKQFDKFITQIRKRDQANYLIWKAIESLFNNLPVSIKNATKKWKICYNTINNVFQNSFDALYVKKYFHANSINDDFDEMFTNIFEQWNNILQKIDWLDDKTKKKALEKLASISITHPLVYKTYGDQEIDEFFTNLEITPDDYLQSMINITIYNRYNSGINLFRKPLNKTSWQQQLKPSSVGAMNLVYNNSIIISPGILQGTFFNKNRPQYMNYGSIGYVIGHEFTHAFDSNGKNFDKLGNIANWWEEESNKEFLSKTKCIIHQYGNYTVEEIGLNIDGERTKVENLADNVGVKVAYLAYEKYMKSYGQESLLPGLYHTQRQLFWISFAQTYCTKMTLAAKKDKIKYDFHSPEEFRVIGSLVNRPEFARDFQCATGTEMNPKNKCTVW